MATNYLTAQRLRELLHYEPDTGTFTRRVSRGPWKIGTVAGTKAGDGYSRIHVIDKPYRAHRLAWLYVHGAWPAAALDHINGNRMDNRIANLREASVEMNSQNIHSARPQNKLGHLGVSESRGGFTAIIKTTLAGRALQLYLGKYKTPEEAHEVYLAAKRRLHDGCTI